MEERTKKESDRESTRKEENKNNKTNTTTSCSLVLIHKSNICSICFHMIFFSCIGLVYVESDLQAARVQLTKKSWFVVKNLRCTECVNFVSVWNYWNKGETQTTSFDREKVNFLQISLLHLLKIMNEKNIVRCTFFLYRVVGWIIWREILVYVYCVCECVSVCAKSEEIMFHQRFNL